VVETHCNSSYDSSISIQSLPSEVSLAEAQPKHPKLKRKKHHLGKKPEREREREHFNMYTYNSTSSTLLEEVQSKPQQLQNPHPSA
jgi:hypothetical protein